MEYDPSDDELWSSLDEALGEMGFDIYSTRQMLIAVDLPQPLVCHVASKLCRRPDRVRRMLEAQCPILLPTVEKTIQACPIKSFYAEIITFIDFFLLECY